MQKKFFGEFDVTDVNKIEEMERMMYGNEFVNKLKTKTVNKKETKLKNTAV